MSPSPTLTSCSTSTCSRSAAWRAACTPRSRRSYAASMSSSRTPCLASLTRTNSRWGRTRYCTSHLQCSCAWRRFVRFCSVLFCPFSRRHFFPFFMFFLYVLTFTLFSPFFPEKIFSGFTHHHFLHFCDVSFFHFSRCLCVVFSAADVWRWRLQYH